MPSLSAGVADRRAALYGPERLQEVHNIQSNLKKTNIFQGGEYNFVQGRESEGIYRSSNNRDYSKRLRFPPIKGTVIAKEPLSRDRVAAFQNDVHFDNRTNDYIPDEVYKRSATHTDFDPKGSSKPRVFQEDRTVRWPDMAPQFATNRAIGNSEYAMTFHEAVLPAHLPLFPLVDTSRLAAPVDLDKNRLNKQVHLSIGTDPSTNYDSEAVRAFTRSAPTDCRSDDPFLLRPLMEEAKRVTRAMREMDIASNVFKDGDYNNMVQGTASIHAMDYGRAMHIPSSARAPSPLPGVSNNMQRPGLQGAQDHLNEEECDIQGGITRRVPGVIQHALDVQVPISLQDGSNVKKDSLSAHFKFGSDMDPSASVYTGDYIPTAIAARTNHQTAPVDSQVLARDPAQVRPTQPTTANEFGKQTFGMAISVNADQIRAALRNMDKRKAHFNFSYDAERHKGDRQASLFHSDFVPAPSTFRPVPPQREPRSSYNYLDTEVALPHPVPKVKPTSNQYQYTGAFMDAARSKGRRLKKDQLTSSRQKFGLDTHFDIGYVTQRHDTTHGEVYTGRPVDDKHVPAAGQSDGVPAASRRFRHLNHSENTQDMQPDFSFLYKQDKPLSLEKREASSLPALPIHLASIMKNDYQPLHQRGMTTQQVLMLRQDAKMSARPVAISHLFHTDTSGNNNLQSTQMVDFIKPELMTGQPTTIAAR